MNNRPTNQAILSAHSRISRSVKLALAGLALGLFTLMVPAQTASPFNLPLFFEANQGETEFASHGNGYEFLISASGAQIALRDAAGPSAVQMQFPGANPRAEIRGDGELSGKINYLIGNDPAKWQTGLPTFSRVQIAEIYPGINLVYHGSQSQLEYDFTIAPGKNPNAIKIHFEGVDKISIDRQGGLALKIGAGEFRQSAPEIYQTTGGVNKIIMGSYKLLDAHTVGFETGDYDHSLPLVIDPVLVYSTFFGGNLNTEAWAVALDTNSMASAPNGSIYIAGQTLAKQFSTAGVVQTNFGGGSFNGDAFVAEFSNPATNLIYLTYLGGNGDDVASSLAVDASGNAFLTGYTASTNFPKVNALYTNLPPYSASFGFQPGSAFIAEINPGGSNLVYSTILGGTNDLNFGESIAVDSADNAYVVGFTYSTHFPVTTNALQKIFPGTNITIGLNYSGFVTEVSSNDASLVYSTYLGGTNADVAESVALDPSGDVYVAGYTASYNFPTWNVPSTNHLNGSTNTYSLGVSDAFVTKFPPLSGTIPIPALTNGSAFYSMFLGGTNSDGAYGIAADASGNAYVTGWTASTNFPVLYPNTNGPPGLSSFLITNGFLTPPITNAFLTKIAANGAIDYSAVFGGAGNDVGYKVAVDSAGNAFVIGTESSTNFPTANTFGPLSATNSLQFIETFGISDVFVTAFTNDCSALLYSVLLGGGLTPFGLGNSFGYGIALDASDNAYITGQTSATNFPTANAPIFPLIGTNFLNGVVLNGTNDAFLSEIQFTPGTVQILSAPTNETAGVGETVNFTITATNTTPLVYQWQSEVFTNILGTNVATGVFTNLLNGGNISGVGSNVLTITNVTTNDAETYSVIVSSGAGTITNSATLTVITSPFITFTALTNQTVGVGSTVMFSLTAFGQPPLHYQWSTNGVNSGNLANGGRISGATTNTLVITDAQTNDSGTYTITVTNAFGTTNLSATLDVLSQPVIVVPLTNQTVGLGATVSFPVTALGEPPLNYSWQFNGTALTNGNLIIGTTTNGISGATTNILFLTAATTNNSGTYEVTITNAFGVTNSSATLTVLTAPFMSIALSSGFATNGLLSFNVVGGTNSGNYYLLLTNNLLAPISTWPKLGPATFGRQGQLSFTFPVNTNDQDEFYMLEFTTNLPPL